MRGARGASAVSLLVSGCAGQRHPTVAELRAVPGATVTYPGSEVYIAGDDEGTFGIDSGNPSMLRVYACATGARSSAQVTAWYDETLTRSGWRADSTGPQTAGPNGTLDGMSWRRGERDFTVRLAASGEFGPLAISRQHKPGCAVAYESIVQ